MTDQTLHIREASRADAGEIAAVIREGLIRYSNFVIRAWTA
jgi:hypothetical protein